MELTGELMPFRVRTVDAKVEAAATSGSWTVTFRSDAVPGTLAAFAGALAVAQLDILSAVIRPTGQGTMTDVFAVVPIDGEALDTCDGERLADLASGILNGHRDAAAELVELRRRHRPHTGVVPRVEANTDSSLTTGINVICADRPGLLYDITSALTAHGLRTRSLAVLTFNRRAHDTFRVVDSAGEPPRDAARLAALRGDLLRVCAE
jgi:[protein-PII] uridylyltransferase